MNEKVRLGQVNHDIMSTHKKVGSWVNFRVSEGLKRSSEGFWRRRVGQKLAVFGNFRCGGSIHQIKMFGFISVHKTRRG